MSGLPNISTFVDSVLPPSVSSVVLSVYNAQADKIAKVNAANQAVNALNASLARDLATGPNSATITLLLQTTDASARPALVRPTSPGSPGSPPKAAVAVTTTKPVAQVTFDISPAGGVGFVQSILDRTEAHQSIHQTAGGFYIDQFGMKPGELNIEAVVAFTSDIATQVQVFKDLLFKAKLLASGNAVTITPPPRLQYTNSVDGRTLLISQTELEIKQSAERPNMAIVSIRATILTDYATPAPVAVDLAANTVGGNSAPLGGSVSLAVATTAGGGALATTTPAVAGVGAL